MVKLPQVLTTDRLSVDGSAKLRRLVAEAFLSMPAAYERRLVLNIVESTERLCPRYPPPLPGYAP